MQRGPPRVDLDARILRRQAVSVARVDQRLARGEDGHGLASRHDVVELPLHEGGEDAAAAMRRQDPDPGDTRDRCGGAARQGHVEAERARRADPAAALERAQAAVELAVDQVVGDHLVSRCTAEGRERGAYEVRVLFRGRRSDLVGHGRRVYSSGCPERTRLTRSRAATVSPIAGWAIESAMAVSCVRWWPSGRNSATPGFTFLRQNDCWPLGG